LKKYKIPIFIFALALLPLICNAQVKGKLLNKYFSPKEYNGSTQNWAITSDNDGLMYFVNHEGVLEYDGNNWRKIEIPNKSTVRSLGKTKSGRILVGAVGEMGYLSPNKIGSLKFVSIKPYIDTNHIDFADIWSIQSTHDGDYYLTDNYLYRFHNKKFKVWEKHGAYFYLCFAINDELYIYEVGTGLQKVVNDSLVLLPKGDFFADKKIHALLPFENKLLAFTRSNGLYVYDPTNKDNPIISYSDISEKTKQINDFFIKNTVYSGVNILSDIFAISTLRSGAIIFNYEGKIIDIINNETSGTSSQIYTLFFNVDGNLWLGLDNGIQKIELSSPFRFWDKTSGITGSVNNITTLKNIIYFATGTGLFKINILENKNNIDITSISSIEGISEQVMSFLLFNPTIGNKNNSINNKSAELINSLNLKDTTLLVGTSKGLYAIIGDKAQLLTDFKGTIYLYQSEFNPTIIYLGLDNGIAYITYNKGKWFFKGYIGKIVDQIKSISEDSKGNLWLAANYKGIYKVTFDKYLISNDSHIDRTPTKIEFYDNSFGIPNMADVLIYKLKNQNKFYSKDVFAEFKSQMQLFG